MADIDDNPEDLTLAKAISYLAFGQLLTAEQLAARRVEKDEPRSEDESAKLHEMATNEERNAIAARRSPDGLKLLADIRAVFADQSVEWITPPDLAGALHVMGNRPWLEYKGAGKPINVRQIAQLLKPFGIAPSTISGESVKGYPIASFPDYDPLPLFGKKALDWVWSRNTGKRLEFTPDDAAEIDDARKRLVKWMVDEKVTGTGRLKKDDKLNDERQNIPSGFLRSGVHVNPLSDSIDEDILLPGNFGRPLKGYQYVQINRAELVAAKRAEKQRPDRSSGGYSEQALWAWYEKWVLENPEAGKIPSRKDDWKAAKDAESKNVPRDAMRALRNELAPETWTKQGRRKNA